MKNKNGNLLCLCTAVAYAAVAVILLLGLITKTKYNFYAIVCVLILGGLLSLAAFFSKSRSRFRPGWVLPQGITGIFAGTMMIVALFIGKYSFTKILLFMLPCLAIITSVLHLAVSVQIKCLGFSRWWILLFFGIIDLGFGGFIYYSFLTEGFNVYTNYGIFFVLLAFQYMLETVTYKITVKCADSEI